MADNPYMPTTNSDGPNFSMTLGDNDSTLAFTQKFAEQTYPEGKMLVKDTTFSQQGWEDRTLVSHNVESIMSGNALSRNPAMPMTAYNRLTNSSLDGMLAYGADYAQTGVTPDEAKSGVPEFSYPDNTSDSMAPKGTKRFLTGTQAFEKAISGSVLGTGFAPGNFQAKATSYLAGMAPTVSNAPGSDTAVDGQYYDVSDDALSMGPNKNNMPAALVSSLTTEEVAIYEKKISILLGSGNFKGNPGKFYINALPGDEAKLKTITESGYKVDVSGALAGYSSRTLPVDGFLDLPDDDKSVFYPSLTLLSFLQEMTEGDSGSYINGGFGFERGKNLIDPSAIQTVGKESISDHALGRGFDIMEFGESKTTKESLDAAYQKSPDTYKAIFEKFVTKLGTMPKYLQPDSVVISGNVLKLYPNGGDNEDRGALLSYIQTMAWRKRCWKPCQLWR
jgi:hypothetical protein